MDQGHFEKRGYLNSDFKLFHLTDTDRQDFEYHYHDFDKIVIFIRGAVNYLIEGRSYSLNPYDIVLVSHNDIHRPDISPAMPYERIIVYLSPSFTASYRTEEYDLSACFKKAKEKHSDVLRIPSLEKSSLFSTIGALEYACSHDDYAKDLYCQVLFLEFMIQLNRAMLKNHLEYLHTSSTNQRSAAVMDYIGRHLKDDLSVKAVADAFYLSESYLMHMFKEETGYTLGNYVTRKRLLAARELLDGDLPVMQVCFDCGFKNYSTFSRAYKKFMQESPQETRRSHELLPRPIH